MLFVPGTLSDRQAGTRACFCLDNFYRTDRFGACRECPVNGYVCENDTAICKPGYFCDWSYDETEKTRYTALMENLRDTSNHYNRRHSVFKGTLPTALPCPNRDSCLGGFEDHCAPGYEGALCAVCSDHYFKRFNKCLNCPSVKTVSIQMSVVALIFILVVLGVLWGETKKMEGNRTVTDVMLSCFKIVVGFYQVISAVYTSFTRVHWPSILVQLAKYIHYVELNILQVSSFKCLNNNFDVDYIDRFVFNCLANVAVVALVLVYMVVRRKYMHKRHMSQASINHMKSNCYRNIFLFLFTTYPMTCATIINVLPPGCRKLCFDQSQRYCEQYLGSDLSIHCFTHRHNKYWHLALLAAAYPLGFPLLIVYLIWRYYYKPLKDRMSGELPEAEGDYIRFASSPDPGRRGAMAQALSLFYENYRKECWYWEMLEMIRKLILTCGLIFVGSHSRTQIGVGAILAAAFTILHVYLKPIRNK